MIEIPAIERSAGCFAKMRTPSPAMVVMAERKILLLKDDIELNTQNTHQTQYPDPTDEHRHK